MLKADGDVNVFSAEFAISILRKIAGQMTFVIIPEMLGPEEVGGGVWFPGMRRLS